MSRHEFKLYVTGRSPRSETALDNLRLLCEQQLKGHYELTVIDVTQEPELAEQDRIIATPTLIKTHPQPGRRIIGDLSDSQQLAAALGIRRTEDAAVAD
jgi:circadian clock protein KaiB